MDHPTSRRTSWQLVLLTLAALTILFLPTFVAAAPPTERTYRIEARSFEYTPPTIQVNQGDRLTIELTSTDVVHGLYVDGYDLNVVADPGQTAKLTFIANQSSSFRFRCSVTCGALHPFMIGKLEVGTNWLWWQAIGFAVLSVAALAVFNQQSEMTRYDLTPLVQPLLKNRLPQFIIQAITLGGFVFAIIAGLVGTPVGNRNFSLVFVWIDWWALLMLIAVPLFGRAWCSVCPIPLAGEWIQHGAILKPSGKSFGLNWRWHNKFRNIWLQNISFALVALFSAVVLTQPNVTSIVLIAFLFVAFAASLIFERRAFCRYLCPVGGFIGLYSQVAPIEVRVKDSAVCAAHTEKSCYIGNAEGYGCPWQVYPGGLTKNTYCGTCMECLRTCPHDNVTIQIRPLGDDLLKPRGRKLDEAFKAFIMLGSAIVYSAVMLGSWGQLKAAAYAVGTSAWALYAITFLVFIFGALPASFFVAASFNRKSFVNFAYALIPLGLLMWIAFSLSFVFANASYLLPAISDPFGWGWNIFGTVNFKWTPLLTQVTPTLQAATLIIGLAWSSKVAIHIGEQIKASAQGVIAFCFVITLGMLWLLVG